MEAENNPGASKHFLRLQAALRSMEVARAGKPNVLYEVYSSVRGVYRDNLIHQGYCRDIAATVLAARCQDNPMLDFVMYDHTNNVDMYHGRFGRVALPRQDVK